MKTAKLLLICLLSLCNLCVLAQHKYRTGEVEFTNGKTESGKILYRNWAISPSEFEFIETSSSQSIKLNGNNTASVTINDDEILERYEFYTVKIDTSLQSLSDLPSSKEPELKEQGIFLQLLFSNGLSLYRANITKNRDQFFVKNATGLPEELIFKKYLPTGNIIRSNETFRNQLLNAFINCNAVSIEEVKKIPYQEKALIQFFEKHSTCISQEKSTFKSRATKTPAIFSAFGGASFNQLKIESQQAFEQKSNFTPGYFGGIGLEKTLQRTNGRYALLASLAYKKYAFSGSQANGAGEKEDDLSYFNIAVGFKRKFIYPRARPFISFHLNNGFLLSEERYFSTKVKEVRKHEQGLQFSLGTEFKKVETSFNFHATNGFSPFRMTNTRITSYALQVSYRLN